ncbi:HlyD family type I secretion periplasmic adaptor subunit [Parvularcula marina]|uniref:Membrane fusion protein (MFP) family protein n=1 Tax=Parvularcula marina TaxID=2292771 RepID=A0A371RI05_9PROT|nr:HlyD family type I secretion periplasmic adaptor subunit [Parvularcula marina]RFB05094.1 HlyD family type I secretion periplasmic adaptor subunit [Parvularcula marina]
MLNLDKTEGSGQETDPLADPVHAITTEVSASFVRIVAVVFGAILVWAAVCQVDRVTRGSGRIVSQERNALIQHLEGGIISQVLVQEGDYVQKGQVMMRIESSFAEAEFASQKVALGNALIRKRRLQAEANGQEELDFLDLPFEVAQDQISQQARLFERRLQTQKETLSVLNEQVAQRRVELSEKQSALTSKRRERELMSERLESLRGLAAEGAVARNDLIKSETEYQQLEAQVSELEHQVQQNDASLSEVKSRKREAEASFRSEAERELAETEAEISRLEQSIAALTDRRQRFDVSAPTSGRINKLYFNTVNGVVRPGQTLAEIVPENAPIAVEAKIAPKDRAKVYTGLKAIVKVSAYDFTRYGGMEGEVIEVSPDALQDEQGNTYFRVMIEAAGDQFGDGNPIVPGMLAEVDIISGQQRVLDYVLRPVKRIQANALRE